MKKIFFILLLLPILLAYEHVESITYSISMTYMEYGNVEQQNLTLGSYFTMNSTDYNVFMVQRTMGSNMLNYLCGMPWINFDPNMYPDASLIPGKNFTSLFNGSDDNLCFINYTCFLSLPNYTTYKVEANYTYLANTTNFSNISTIASYQHFCTIYGIGGNASTDNRTLTFLGDISANEEGDYLILGTIFALALIALLFGYMHTNARSEMWSQLWFFFTCLLVLATLMSINVFANEEGNTQVADIAMALFTGFVWIFIVSVYVFLWNLIKQFFTSLQEFVNGKKKSANPRQRGLL